ncbi:transglutaminase domain-containing protein [Flavobacterium sp.]|jgi:hypothetical protein|uniref:transglutaminase domain-containing protein n=1 Tax=Flavobacterium sp. TaxID=239 RepID=UPI0037BEFDED
MKNTFLLFTFLFSVLGLCQSNVGYDLIDRKIAAIPIKSATSTDEIAKYINANFKTENDKIRAVFFYTTSNLSYDVANMFTVNSDETPQDRILKALKTKKGICWDYALIYNEIANLVGIKSVVIQGYTKQNGKVDTMAHAWCASRIGNKWYLFDPTWGSGYVNNNKYTQKINNIHFKVEPSKMINSHIPFDYLWQFINYPITNQEFIIGKTQIDKTKKIFDFESEITKYESLPKMDQFFESAQRIEKNGLKNQLISQAYTYAKSSWNYERETENNTKFNQIVTLYNTAIVELNDFVYYRNNKFKPTITDEELKQKITSLKNKFLNCQELLNNLGKVDSGNLQNVNSMKSGLTGTLKQAEEQEVFVTTYLSKSKLVRKTMFSKVTWFGIPLN